MKYRFLLAVALMLSFCVKAHADTSIYEKILGRWLRPDGGYVLMIENVDEEGNLNASYLNPKKINVSKARIELEDERINVFIELKDRYYPGNYYELTYYEEVDRLIGTYYHLGINQQFDVNFIRKE